MITAAFASPTFGDARKWSCEFFGYDPAATRNAPSNPSPAELAENTIDYAEAKEAYFKALRAEVPELLKIAMGMEARPLELDTFAAAFAVAGEDQEMRRMKRRWFC
jgi:hypothetical protein